MESMEPNLSSSKLARFWLSSSPLSYSLLHNVSSCRELLSQASKNNMLKVAVIGGGSTYTPELVNGFLARVDKFPLDELWLVDVDEERLKVVGGFAQRMVDAKGAPFKVILTSNQRDAVKDASYVTTQLRVGHMEARRRDEYLGLRHGLIGQETTGIGGMAKALRTIPVILKIAKDIKEVAKEGTMLVNFTNPAG